MAPAARTPWAAEARRPKAERPELLVNSQSLASSRQGSLGAAPKASAGLACRSAAGRRASRRRSPLEEACSATQVSQLQGTGEPPGGVAVADRIHVSIREAMLAAAAAPVTGGGCAKSEAKPTGLGGGAAAKGAMPPPTVTAKAAKADSMPGAARGEAKAPARDAASAETAASTATEAARLRPRSCPWRQPTAGRSHSSCRQAPCTRL